jgi:hypothetical protein
MIRTREDGGITIDVDDEERVDAMMHMSFWCFVFFHGCVLHCGWPRALLTRNDIYAAAGLRTIAMWVICRPAHKRAALVGGACLYAVWLIAYFNVYYDAVFLAIIIVTALMDGVLALGHVYDVVTPALVESNCRLCYIAVSGWAAIALPLLIVG